MQTKVNFWLRVQDRPQWEALKEKGIKIAEILSRGIQLVYEQEVEHADVKASNENSDVVR